MACADRNYKFVKAPKDILNGGWTYVSSAMDKGNSSPNSPVPCKPRDFPGVAHMDEYQGGFRGRVPDNALVGICCANHHDKFERADGEFPVVNAMEDSSGKGVTSGVFGIKWFKHAGTFKISDHGGEPWYEGSAVHAVQSGPWPVK